MNGDDKVLLDGTASSSKVTFKKSGKRKAFLSCTALVIILALLLGIGFLPGLLVGKVIYGSHEESSSDWGADVSVGGKTVPVVEWLDTELQPSNIKENLRCMSKHVLDVCVCVRMVLVCALHLHVGYSLICVSVCFVFVCVLRLLVGR